MTSPPLPPPPGPQGWNAGPPVPIPPVPVEPAGEWTIRPPGALGAIDVVEVGFSLWGQRWRRLALLSLLLSGSIGIVQALLDPGPSVRELAEWVRAGGADPLPQASPRAQAFGLASLILGPVLALATYRILLGAAVTSVPETGQAIVYGFRRVGSGLWLFVAFFLTAMIVVLASSLVALVLAVIEPALALLAVAPALYLLARLLAVAIPALVADDARGFKAIARSWQLVGRRVWPSLGVLCVATLVILVGGFATILMQILIPGEGVAGDLARAAAAAAGGAIVGPLTGAILAALYLDLRARGDHDGPGAIRRLLERHDPA
jgi:hypothetical protein